MRSVAALFLIAGLSETSIAQPIRLRVAVPRKSQSSGFFIGAGVEGNSLFSAAKTNTLSANESGIGFGLVTGYGLTPMFSLFGQMSVAAFENVPGERGSFFGQVDVGGRLHFRTGPNVVVPFVQAAWSARLRQRAESTPSDLTGEIAGGEAISLGGGINAHIRPADCSLHERHLGFR